MKLSISDYAKECWETQTGQKIVQEHASADWSECYDQDAAHVFELDNGKFLFVRESGCSCYDYSDAFLDVVDTLDEAMTLYKKQAP